ncbi:MAG: TraR/DksA family transcriptional regulator [Gammaproteobacteria bacterium]|nr:TraR/DksA family transcriptional regulator [Gammaproteobacteria bacterium]
MQSINKIEEKLKTLRADYMSRRDAIHKETWHTEQAVEKDFAEQVTQRENDDVLDALDDDAKQAVMQIDNALLRIKAGNYGICPSCGSPIPEQRLDAIPYAEYCVSCADKAQ